MGTATFERGSGYAHGGAVRNRTWSPGGTRVVGEVQGGAARPYVASVELTRSTVGGAVRLPGHLHLPGRGQLQARRGPGPGGRPGPGRPNRRAPTLTLVRGGEVARTGGPDGPGARRAGPGRPAADGSRTTGPSPSRPCSRPTTTATTGPRPRSPGTAEIALQFELTLGAMTVGPPLGVGHTGHPGPAGGAGPHRRLGAGRDLVVGPRLLRLRPTPVGPLRGAAPAGQGAAGPEPGCRLPPEPLGLPGRDGPAGGHQQPAPLGPARGGPGPRAAAHPGRPRGPAGDPPPGRRRGDHRRDPDGHRAPGRAPHRHATPCASRSRRPC